MTLSINIIQLILGGNLLHKLEHIEDMTLDCLRHIRIILLSFILLLLFQTSTAQNKLLYKGQASALLGYSPEANLDLQLSGRYITEINYIRTIDSNRLFDIELSANISGALSSLPFDSFGTYNEISPYRMWARYSGKQIEIRAGLQKIDFGSATLLRPLQWLESTSQSICHKAVY